MKHIMCLVDFTDTAHIAVKQAIEVAKVSKASIILCHIIGNDKQADDQLIKDLWPLQSAVEEAGIECEFKIGQGSFFAAAEECVHEERPDLVVIGTHGKKGLRQNLFGSNIYKLVKALPVPSLVVNDATTPVEGGFKKVLLPVAPHPDFLLKVEQAAALLAPAGKIYIFEIRKPGAGFDEQVEKNIKAAEKWLEEQGVAYEVLEKGSRSFSVGFSQETIAYAEEEGFDLIAIMAVVSEQNRNFGQMDKENLLLNKEGLPVLCANH